MLVDRDLALDLGTNLGCRGEDSRFHRLVLAASVLASMHLSRTTPMQ